MNDHLVFIALFLSPFVLAHLNDTWWDDTWQYVSHPERSRGNTNEHGARTIGSSSFGATIGNGNKHEVRERGDGRDMLIENLSCFVHGDAATSSVSDGQQDEACFKGSPGASLQHTIELAHVVHALGRMIQHYLDTERLPLPLPSPLSSPPPPPPPPPSPPPPLSPLAVHPTSGYETGSKVQAVLSIIDQEGLDAPTRKSQKVQVVSAASPGAAAHLNMSVVAIVPPPQSSPPSWRWNQGVWQLSPPPPPPPQPPSPPSPPVDSRSTRAYAYYLEDQDPPLPLLLPPPPPPPPPPPTESHITRRSASSPPLASYSARVAVEAWKTHFHRDEGTTETAARRVVNTTRGWMRGLQKCLKRPILYRASHPFADWLMYLATPVFRGSSAFVTRGGHSMTLRPRFFADPFIDATAPPRLILRLKREEQTHIVVHECTHLLLRTRDHAYTFQQQQFERLRGSRAVQNADSVTMFLLQVLRTRWGDTCAQCRL